VALIQTILRIPLRWNLTTSTYRLKFGLADSIKIGMPEIVNRFVKHVVPGVIQPIRIIWNQVIGFLFLVLAAWPASSAVKDIMKFDGSGEGLVRIVFTVVFALCLGYFGVTSFWRARKIGRAPR